MASRKASDKTYRRIDPDTGHSIDANSQSTQNQAQLQWETVRETVLRAGTVTRLVQALLAPTGEVDARHLHVLLATYRPFTTSANLLDEVLALCQAHCCSQNGAGSLGGGAEREGTGVPQKLDAIRSILLCWLDIYPDDFNPSSPLALCRVAQMKLNKKQNENCSVGPTVADSVGKESPIAHASLTKLIQFCQLHQPHLTDVATKAAKLKVALKSGTLPSMASGRKSRKKNGDRFFMNGGGARSLGRLDGRRRAALNPVHTYYRQQTVENSNLSFYCHNGENIEMPGCSGANSLDYGSMTSSGLRYPPPDYSPVEKYQYEQMYCDSNDNQLVGCENANYWRESHSDTYSDDENDLSDSSSCATPQSAYAENGVLRKNCGNAENLAHENALAQVYGFVPDVSRADPVYVAEQLTFTDAALLCSLYPWQCSAHFWSKRQRSNQDGAVVTSVKDTVGHFNALSHRVLASVLWGGRDRGPKVYRARALAQWVCVAKELRVLKNFSSLKAVLSALQSEPIHRLKSVWELVPPEVMDEFKSLCAIFDEQSDDKENGIMNGQSAIMQVMERDVTSKCSQFSQPLNTSLPYPTGPVPTSRRNARKMTQKYHRTKSEAHCGDWTLGCVPYLGPFLTELTKIDEAYPDTVEGNLINFDKRRKEFDVFARLRLFQCAARAYHLTKDENFDEWFSALPSMDEKACYERSLEIEPVLAQNSSSPEMSQQPQRKLAKSSTLSRIFSQLLHDTSSTSDQNASANSSGRGENEWFPLVPECVQGTSVAEKEGRVNAIRKSQTSHSLSSVPFSRPKSRHRAPLDRDELFNALASHRRNRNTDGYASDKNALIGGDDKLRVDSGHGAKKCWSPGPRVRPALVPAPLVPADVMPRGGVLTPGGFYYGRWCEFATHRHNSLSPLPARRDGDLIRKKTTVEMEIGDCDSNSKDYGSGGKDDIFDEETCEGLVLHSRSKSAVERVAETYDIRPSRANTSLDSPSNSSGVGTATPELKMAHKKNSPSNATNSSSCSSGQLEIAQMNHRPSSSIGSAGILQGGPNKLTQSHQSAKDSAILCRVGLDDCVLPAEKPGANYKCIRLESGDRISGLISKSLEKHLIAEPAQNFDIVQLLPNGNELYLPPKCNPYYACVQEGGASAVLNLVLRRKDSDNKRTGPRRRNHSTGLHNNLLACTYDSTLHSATQHHAVKKHSTASSSNSSKGSSTMLDCNKSKYILGMWAAGAAARMLKRNRDKDKMRQNLSRWNSGYL